MPKVKIGKTYPISYFSNFDDTFQARNGVFTYRGYKFERVGRNQLKVVEEVKEQSNASDRS